MTVKIEFDVVVNDGIRKITNNSEYDLVLYLKPVAPKRKYIKFLIIPPRGFVFFELVNLPDLKRLTFELEKKDA